MQLPPIQPSNQPTSLPSSTEITTVSEPPALCDCENEMYPQHTGIWAKAD